MIWNHSKQFLVNWCCRVKPEFFLGFIKIKHKSGNKHCEHLLFLLKGWTNKKTTKNKNKNST